MTSPSLLTHIAPSLKAGPATLEQLLAEHAALWQSLGWQAAQVSLWLACAPALRVCVTPAGERAYALDSAQADAGNSLADELVALLQKAGRPLPLAQLGNKLPPGMLVTEPMLRNVAKQDARLALKGPLLVLA